MTSDKFICKTASVCPVCLKQIPAEKIKRNQEIIIIKNCPEHGNFETVIWRGQTDIEDWCQNAPSFVENPLCPTACGLCSEHRQDTCCVVYEITKRCNLNCRFCFADAGKNRDISMEQIKNDLRKIIVPGKTLIQLSGGEPTVRDDLPEIIKEAKKAGAKYIQLNSNGLRLAEDEKFVQDIVKAGVSFIFMQFDGTEDAIYKHLRGKPLLQTKLHAIKNCEKYGLGVTLVPTLVKNINTQNIGEIIKIGMKMSPTVRGIHFQPASYFGRIPQAPENEKRYTLGELLDDIETQTLGFVKKNNLAPACCDHPLCGFHGSFVVLPDNTLMPLTVRKNGNGSCCCATAEENREYVGTRWERNADDQQISDFDITTMDGFINRVKAYSFTITSMAFQDAWNIDLARLQQCSLHVFRNGKFIPMCANYLTSSEGRSIYND
ncbi:MAG: radical SAM (seleno)protein TrsS [Bacillota bacterium]